MADSASSTPSGSSHNLLGEAHAEDVAPSSAERKTAAKGRFLIAEGPVVGPVDKRLGSLVSRMRIYGARTPDE